MTTAILGGGLSGITLARLLHERGGEPIVLEAGPEPGGLCRSQRTDGFTFDTGGSHIIFSREQEVLAFMRRMIAGNEQRSNRNTKISYKGRYVKYPFENGLSDLPDEDRFLCLSGFIRTLIAVEKGELAPPANFREWIYYTFGPGIADCYLIPYNEKIWKYPAADMSLHWVDGRIPRPPVDDIIKSAIGIPTEGYTHQAVFSYPLDGGIASLVAAIAAPVRDRIRTGFAVTSIRRSGGGWLIGNGNETIRADRIISTIPVQHLLPCLESVPEDVAAACRALVYNSLASVSIGIRGPVPAVSWMYIPDGRLGLANRLSFPSNFSRHAAPGGCSSLLAEITFRPGDEVSRMTDRELVAEVLAMLGKMAICKPDQVVLSSVSRQPFAYVVYDLAYQQNIRTVRSFCASRDIPLVGRFARFEYLNMDACIRDAMEFVAAYPRP